MKSQWGRVVASGLLLVLLTGSEGSRESPVEGSPAQGPEVSQDHARVTATAIREPQQGAERWSVVTRPDDEAPEVGGLAELVVVIDDPATVQCESGRDFHVADLEVGTRLRLPPIRGVRLSDPPIIGVEELIVLGC